MLKKILFIAIALLVWLTFLKLIMSFSLQKINVGDTWYYIDHTKDPFRKTETNYCKIIAVKKGYVQYELNGNYKHSLSAFLFRTGSRRLNKGEK